MNVHEGHRERLRDSFREHGLDTFNDLNALELLLFYAVPRRDTNALAHALLDAFGSLSAVFQATEEQLCQVPGVGVQTACLLRLVPQMMRKSEISDTAGIKYIRDYQAAGRYLVPRFLYEENEKLLMLCLDTQKRIIGCTELSQGVANATDVCIRRLVNTAAGKNAVSVIVAHNHPGGEPVPSVEDDGMTRAIERALHAAGIDLDDHIIVAGNRYFSYRHSAFPLTPSARRRE